MQLVNKINFSLAAFCAVILISLLVPAATHPSNSKEFFDTLSPTYQLETILKTSIVQVGQTTKAFEKKDSSAKKNLINSVYSELKQSWNKEFESRFTAVEKKYLQTVFEHRLFLRLNEFNKDFLDPQKTQSRIETIYKTKIK